MLFICHEFKYLSYRLWICSMMNDSCHFSYQSLGNEVIKYSVNKCNVHTQRIQLRMYTLTPILLESFLNWNVYFANNIYTVTY